MKDAALAFLRQVSVDGSTAGSVLMRAEAALRTAMSLIAFRHRAIGGLRKTMPGDSERHRIASLASIPKVCHFSCIARADSAANGRMHGPSIPVSGLTTPISTKNEFGDCKNAAKTFNTTL